MVIYPYHVLRRRKEKKKEKKISYVLALNGSSLTLWTLLGLGRDNIPLKDMSMERVRVEKFGESNDEDCE